MPSHTNIHIESHLIHIPMTLSSFAVSLSGLKIKIFFKTQKTYANTKGED
jgi:hypothetical protein